MRNKTFPLESIFTVKTILIPNNHKKKSLERK